MEGRRRGQQAFGERVCVGLGDAGAGRGVARADGTAARMIEGGEDPRILFRRAIAMAAEDVGLADPNALLIAVAAREAFDQLGAPEGFLPLAEMTIYLATAPKSNSAMKAMRRAFEAARETPAAPVPLHLRNAPTQLMKDLGYGAEYKYAHDDPDHFVAQSYLPEVLAGRAFYEPGRLGFETKVAERLTWWRQKAAGPPTQGITPSHET